MLKFFSAISACSAVKIFSRQDKSAREREAGLPGILDKDFKERWKHGYA
jgi:hypothetical protein